MLRTLYTIGFTALTPFLILRLWAKSLRAPLYRKRILERFGFFKFSFKQKSVWIHAVSVGEVVAAIPIVHYIQKKFPNHAIVFTTMTPTGSSRVKQAFGDQVFHVYIPYDFPWALNRFFAKIKPCLFIILETELWPNILFACQARQIPVIVANAHLSERSVRGYSRIPALTQKMLQCIHHVAAQSKLDAERFLKIGLEAQKLSVMGNIKFDVQYKNSAAEIEKINDLKKNFNGRFVWIAASTHPCEEFLILSAFKIIQNQIPNVLLFLVPRHPERFKSVEMLIQEQNLSVLTRSSGSWVQANTAVLLGDTVGELLAFYQTADIAFVGGSLVEVGGHNLLEPAALGVPIITGPYLHNYVEISHLLLKAGGMVKISTVEELAATIIQWFNFPAQRFHAGKCAQNVVHKNQGTTQHLFNLIDKLTT